MSKNRVYLMQVSEQAAGGRSEYHGKAYYFCSPACKAKFATTPEEHAAK
jgi:YHS domain-containing protein